MPGKKRSSYGQYDENKLEEAVGQVKDGRMSLRKAAAHYGVPKTTIQNRASGKTVFGKSAGRQPVIPALIEKEMAKKIKSSSDKGFGLTRKQVMIKAVRICNKYKIRHPFNPVSAGKTWFYGFMRRHTDLSLRKPQKLSTSRSKSMDKSIVNAYFVDLGRILVESNLIHAPEKIWNMDESGFQLEHTPANVVSRKGAKSVPSRVSMSREHVTVVACVNADGGSMPPLMIVKGKTERSLTSYNVAGGPPGALWTYQQKAWMEDLLGERWFKDVFLRNCGPERPQLLILDGHHSHEVMDLLEKAREENIIIVAMPPHSSHWLQPLDKGCFGPLSKRFNVVCTEFMSTHYLNVVTKASFASLFAEAWAQTMTSKNIRKGFLVTGIHPFNPSIIPQNAFVTFLGPEQKGQQGNVHQAHTIQREALKQPALAGHKGVETPSLGEGTGQQERVQHTQQVGGEREESAVVEKIRGKLEGEGVNSGQVGGLVGESAIVREVLDKLEGEGVNYGQVSGLVGESGVVEEVQGRLEGWIVNFEQVSGPVGEDVKEASVGSGPPVLPLSTESEGITEAVPVITDPEMVQALLSLIASDPIEIAAGGLDDIFSVGESASVTKNVSKTANKRVHRILTSDSVLQLKREERERKEKRESMKEEREKRKNEAKVGKGVSRTIKRGKGKSAIVS